MLAFRRPQKLPTRRSCCACGCRRLRVVHTTMLAFATTAPTCSVLAAVLPLPHSAQQGAQRATSAPDRIPLQRDEEDDRVRVRVVSLSGAPVVEGSLRSSSTVRDLKRRLYDSPRGSATLSLLPGCSALPEFLEPWFSRTIDLVPFRGVGVAASTGEGDSKGEPEDRSCCKPCSNDQTIAALRDLALPRPPHERRGRAAEASKEENKDPADLSTHLQLQLVRRTDFRVGERVAADFEEFLREFTALSQAATGASWHYERHPALDPARQDVLHRFAAVFFHVPGLVAAATATASAAASASPTPAASIPNACSSCSPFPAAVEEVGTGAGSGWPSSVSCVGVGSGDWSGESSASSLGEATSASGPSCGITRTCLARTEASDSDEDLLTRRLQSLNMEQFLLDVRSGNGGANYLVQSNGSLHDHAPVEGDDVEAVELEVDGPAAAGGAKGSCGCGRGAAVRRLELESIDDLSDREILTPPESKAIPSEDMELEPASPAISPGRMLSMSTSPAQQAMEYQAMIPFMVRRSSRSRFDNAAHDYKCWLQRPPAAAEQEGLGRINSSHDLGPPVVRCSDLHSGLPARVLGVTVSAFAPPQLTDFVADLMQWGRVQQIVIDMKHVARASQKSKSQPRAKVIKRIFLPMQRVATAPAGSTASSEAPDKTWVVPPFREATQIVSCDSGGEAATVLRQDDLLGRDVEILLPGTRSSTRLKDPSKQEIDLEDFVNLIDFSEKSGAISSTVAGHPKIPSPSRAPIAAETNHFARALGFSSSGTVTKEAEEVEAEVSGEGDPELVKSSLHPGSWVLSETFYDKASIYVQRFLELRSAAVAEYVTSVHRFGLVWTLKVWDADGHLTRRTTLTARLGEV